MKIENVAFVFPGQGSQHVGMGFELAQSFPIAREIYSKADEILGLAISSLSWYGPGEQLNDTVNTQPALFTHSIAALSVYQTYFPNIQPLAVAGHSMGELSALTAAGSLNFEDGIQLTRTRGRLMKQAGELSPGSMAAVLGLTLPEVEQICKIVSTGHDTLQVANDNCPGQIVVSGTIDAIESALPLLQAAGARRVVKLAVSIAAHSQLMENAQEEFCRVIENTHIGVPHVPIIGNVNAKRLDTVDSIKQDLQNQLSKRVRWTETIIKLKHMGVINYIEMGSGAVLTGLIKRIDPEANTFTMGTPHDIETIFNRLDDTNCL